MSAKKKNDGKEQPFGRFFAELARRRVLQIGGAYIAGAWLGAEIFNFLFLQFGAPAWAYRLLAIVFVVGFPIALVLAWTVQVGEDGSWQPDPERGDHRTIGWAIVLGVVLTAGLSWLILPQAEPEPAYQPLPSSLAVIPLGSSLGTPGAEAAAETLYRSLMTGLEQSPGLTLVQLGPTEQPGDPVEFGQSLGVAALALGRIEAGSQGDVVRLELYDTVAAAMTWAEQYAWDPTRTVETATEIANGLLGAMQLPEVTSQRFTGTANAEAYAAFLRGGELAATWTAESLAGAMEAFQAAIDFDPGFAQAYAGLAQAIYDYLELADLDDAERVELQGQAERAVRFAQKLDPESPDALSLLGYAQDNRQMRIVAYERALELDPGHAISYFRYAQQMQADGKLEDAERLMLRAVTLEPMNPRFRLALAGLLEQQGRDAEAAAEREKAAAFRR